VPVQKIGDVIANSGNLRSLAQRARRLEELQHLLFEAVPPALAGASRVSNYRSGLLVISADNAAVAAKLRQLAPRLLSHLEKSAILVTGIRVDVQVKAHKIKDEHHVTGNALPPDAIQKFSDLAGRLPPSPLKSAVMKLARRGASRRRPRP
jgi:hypothetical protein